MSAEQLIIVCMAIGAFVLVARWLDGLPEGNEDLGRPQLHDKRPPPPQGSGGYDYFDRTAKPHGRIIRRGRNGLPPERKPGEEIPISPPPPRKGQRVAMAGRMLTK